MLKQHLKEKEMEYKVEVLVGEIVVDYQYFAYECDAVSFASDKQDEGFKVRITP